GGYFFVKHLSDRQAAKRSTDPKTSRSADPKVEERKPDTVDLKVEFTEETAKSRYFGTFRKALVTNIGDTTARMPSVAFDFFKGDVKVDSDSSKIGIPYMRPGETFPVWVQVNDKKEFDRVTGIQATGVRPDEMGDSKRFLSLPIVGASLSVKERTSLVNFKPVREDFYEVTGVIENDTQGVVDVDIYAILYDKEKNIIGFASDSPDEIKPGQKIQFDIVTSRNQIFGEAADYKLIIISGE
ncbi:MAG: FxLYD domain-containing protein, partial [Acidobacteria bacterium]|nr:FxLYD domain-containing protein [Acidobacteriota bacterium]